MESLENKIAETANPVKNEIALNVGGKIFTTTKSTLMKCEGSYFYAMLGSGQFKPNETGNYFIVRYKNII